jgi:antitoxin VapB
MAFTKVFQSGNSQAVRIPREFRLDTDRVEILRRGEEIILRKPSRNLVEVFEILTALPRDFLSRGRRQPKMQKRPGL